MNYGGQPQPHYQGYPTTNYPPQPSQYGQAQQEYKYKPHQSAEQLYNPADMASSQQPQPPAKAKWNDVWALVLFLVNLVVFAVISSLGFVYLRDRGITKSPFSMTPWPKDAGPMLFTITGVTIGAAAVISLVYFLMMRQFSQFMVKFSIFFSLMVYAGYTLMFYVWEQWVIAILMTICFLFTAIYFYAVRHRIPLAAVTMETVCDVTKKFPALLLITILSLGVQVVFSGWWSYTAVGAGYRFAKDAGPLSAIYIYLVFCLYWISQVLKNSLHVTTAGTVASFYFLEGTAAMPKNPTLQSAKRAFTSSFGSVCYGSLIIALIQTFRYIMLELSRTHEVLAAIVDCILACIQGMIEYFNSWAYVQVAVYGKPFGQAARDTWALLGRSGVDVIAGDLLVGTVLSSACLLVGCISAGIAYAWGYLYFQAQFDNMAPAVALVSVICFLSGFVMMMTVSMVIDSGVQTTLVCLAENPAALANSKPQLYNKFKQAYPQLHWGV